MDGLCRRFLLSGYGVRSAGRRSYVEAARRGRTSLQTVQLALPEERLTLSTDPVGAFRKHMDKIVRASRKKSRASAKPVFESNPACEFAEYLAITKDEGATYRIKSITYFLILQESQYLTPHYSLKALWRDVCVKCDLLDIDPPTLGFVRDRLHSRHRSLLLEMIGR